MLVNIILYLLQMIQQLYQQNCWLLNFICRYIPLRQHAFDDANSPKYQRFKTDELPKITYHQNDWQWQDLIRIYQWQYGKTVKPIKRRGDTDIPEKCTCPNCDAPRDYLYRNNGKAGQLMCKVCSTLFSPDENRFCKEITLKCPYCSHTLDRKKSRKFFIIHKCVNPKCPYYLHNLKHVDKADLAEDYGKNKYKLHYIYREFTIDFFRIELDSLPKNASSFRFEKFDPHIVSLCLTLHINLGLSLRKTSRAMLDLYGVSISHQQIANYCKTAAVCVKPLVDHYPYEPGSTFVADETYIKVRGVKAFVWFIMDATSRSILGYRVSDNRSVGPCIMAMRMAFKHFKDSLPDKFRFIADGYSAYPLAAQQFFRQFGEKMKFDITQVIGLTNDDAVSTEFRPFKQMVERLNRTYKASYRPTCGFDSLNGADYDLSLWVAYYNFLRPHAHRRGGVLNEIPELHGAGNMPGKWEFLISLGQQTILNLQKQNGA